MTTAHMLPEWVMFGIQGEGHVLLYASRELDTVTFRAIIDRGQGFLVDALVRGIWFSGSMRRYVVTKGDTYAEALARLGEFWDRETGEAPQPAIGEQSAALGAG